MKILVLEPYYGGSHKRFLDELQSHLPLDLIKLTLPARKWKWRMRLGAPFFAGQVRSLDDTTDIAAVLCSSFIDVATLRTLLPASLNRLPFLAYFHENQFSYPVQQQDERDIHFGLTNLTTVLASDRVAFNTSYNLQTFLSGVRRILKKCPDMKFAGVTEKMTAKITILYPGIDFREIDRAADSADHPRDIPVIVWNHRWEHDKNPAFFFETLYKLDRAGCNFKLIILGQCFQRKPSVFLEAQKKLRHRIIHAGFVESRNEYARLLSQGDIVVSTAKHEFYGISIIEGIRAGCRPLLPNRLSYPELFSAAYLYDDEELFDKLKSLLASPARIDKTTTRKLTDRFAWKSLENSYLQWLSLPAENPKTRYSPKKMLSLLQNFFSLVP